jgi:hypothetical protein
VGRGRGKLIRPAVRMWEFMDESFRRVLNRNARRCARDRAPHDPLCRVDAMGTNRRDARRVGSLPHGLEGRHAYRRVCATVV